MEDSFVLEESLVIDKSGIDGHVSVTPVLFGDRIFFSDLDGNRVYGAPVASDDSAVSLASSDAFVVRAQSPYGLVVGADERLYINERMTSRVQVLTAQGENVLSISHRGNADEIHMIRDEPGHVELLLVGPAVCSAQTVCSSRRIEIVDDRVVADRTFDEQDESPSVMTWTGSVDNQTGNTYVANVGSSEIRVFDDALEQVAGFNLAVPESVALRDAIDREADRRPYAYSGPRMYRMVIAGDNIVVQWIASPPDSDAYRYVVGVYDLQGDVVVDGVSTDLRLSSASGGSLVFWSSGSGASPATVYRYGLR